MYDNEAELERKTSVWSSQMEITSSSFLLLRLKHWKGAAAVTVYWISREGSGIFMRKVMLNISDISGTVAWCLCRSSVKI